MAFRIVGFQHIEGREGDTCEHCGHDIKQVYTIQAEDGTRMRVGCECVVTLTARTAACTEAMVIDRRFKRACAQWRSNKPLRRDGETRGQYIERRMAEMANAKAAAQAWTAESVRYFANKRLMYGWADSFAQRVERRLRQTGAYRNVDVARAIYERHVERIARRYGANPFDFMRPMWDVAKI